MNSIQNRRTDTRSEYVFPPSVKRFGMLGLLGLVAFMSSIIVLHLTSNGIDWMHQYVSNLANQPLGWIFVAGTFVHGLGNLALTLGLRDALRPGPVRTWAVLFFGLAAAGILLAALFPTDFPNQVASMTGRIHRSVASASFALELAALFIFTAAFRRQRRWRRQRAVSVALSVGAAVALTVFVIAIQVDVVPGLAERFALIIFLAWEIWASVRLIQFG